MEVSSGNSHTCGLREDGTIRCWGWLKSTSGPTILPQPQGRDTFVTLDSGSFHVCALRTDGLPVCWESNDDGEATPLESWPETGAVPASGYTPGNQAGLCAIQAA